MLHMPIALCRMLKLMLLATLMLAMSPSRAQENATLLLFEVRVEQYVVAEALAAYQIGDDIFFPLGELAHLLGIGIQTYPRSGTAQGFIINEARRFSLNARTQRYAVGRQSGTFDPEAVWVREDDIYVATSLLRKWLPLEINIELSKLLLQLRPLETLPLQARMERERRAAQLERQMELGGAAYPQHPLPYRLFDLPYLDQTFSVNSRRYDGESELDSAYTVFATGDLLGMEASLYFSHYSDLPSPDPRLTLARHDPGAGLLGPLRARSVELGSIIVPGIDNVSVASLPGNGLRISNRPLVRPLDFSRHIVQGNLPPGWDVELYFNEALIGLQRANANGRYRFDDLPLIAGVNEFRLVFYGPLGQIRVERQRILLEPSIVRPGEFFYSLAEQEDENGGRRSSLQFDAGLSQSLLATGGISTVPFGDEEKRYANLGLRQFWKTFILSGDFATSEDGGTLAELGLRTRIGNMGVEVSRTQLNDFVSELFAASANPIESRNLIRLNGSFSALPRLSMALEARQDNLQSGDDLRNASLRLSGVLRDTALSHTWSWFKAGDYSETNGRFRLSRRVANIGFTGQVGYRVQPDGEATDALITADKPLGKGYRLNLSAARLYPLRQNQYTIGLTKGLGRFGLSIDASHIPDGETALGMQLFIALGREPRQGRWIPDAQPIAQTGAASLRVFLDHNQNAVMDEGDEAIPGAGFVVQGSDYPVRTDPDGIALIDRLPGRRYADIALDMSTLEDPQWTAQRPGVRLLPRPGRVAEIDVPVVQTAEIEGTVYLNEESDRRGIGDAVVELVNSQGKVVGETLSAADGIYVMPNVAPGVYELRISPEQLRRLGLRSSAPHRIAISGDAALVIDRDFLVSPAKPGTQSPSGG
jgi:hypothetical protein